MWLGTFYGEGDQLAQGHRASEGSNLGTRCFWVFCFCFFTEAATTPIQLMGKTITEAGYQTLLFAMHGAQHFTAIISYFHSHTKVRREVLQPSLVRWENQVSKKAINNSPKATEPAGAEPGLKPHAPARVSQRFSILPVHQNHLKGWPQGGVLGPHPQVSDSRSLG